MRSIFIGLVALCAIQIPIALFGFLSFFKTIPRLGESDGVIDLRVTAHLIWPVACLIGPFLARFPARRGDVTWVLILGLAPAAYGVLLALSGL